MDSHLMLQYLSSSMFPGTGLAAASEIIDAYGKDLYNKVNEPNAVEQICAKIPSLKPQPVKNMVSILRNSGAFKELFDYVTAFGGNYAAANKLYSQYGADAIQMLRGHPYQYGLTNGLKFATCDRIACDNGLDAVCSERLRAIIRNALILKSSGGGHVFASWHDVSAAAVRVQKDNSFGVNIPECVLLYHCTFQSCCYQGK